MQAQTAVPLPLQALQAQHAVAAGQHATWAALQRLPARLRDPSPAPPQQHLPANVKSIYWYHCFLLFL